MTMTAPSEGPTSYPPNPSAPQDPVVTVACSCGYTISEFQHIPVGCPICRRRLR